MPVALLLAILNLLPLVFQHGCRLYERPKAYSAVDLSVVERFFLFQFVNVYVSVGVSAILVDVESAWASPLTFFSRIAKNTPRAAFYFASLVAFQCGTSPLWLLRAWPLLSRGWKTWTVTPPELPAMMYAWAFPKVMMTFTIFCTFWVFAPLLSLFALAYFSLVALAFRYLILYAHIPVYDSGGEFWYRAVARALFGLFVSNGILVFWLLSRNLYAYAAAVAPLPLVVYAFRNFAREAYEVPSRTIALDEAVARDAAVETRIAPTFDPALYAQPALRDRPTKRVDLPAYLSGAF